MSFFMITEGATQIEQLFIGKTRDEVVQNARPMINRWPEYECLEDQELIELTEEEEYMEFDLVEIQGDWPGINPDKEKLITMYNQQYGG